MTSECPDCGKPLTDSYAVNRHLNSGRCKSRKASAPPQRRSGRKEEIPPEPDPVILRQDTELEELLASSPCQFAK